MALILNIETSTKSTSVALAKDGILVALKEEHEVVSHATKLTPFILEILKDVNLKLKDIDAIAISIGPGSYTGLRIGLSTAKGLCYSLGKPLIKISALEALIHNIKNKHTKNNELFVSVMDSRKNELYLCSSDSSLHIIDKPIAIKVDSNFIEKYNHKNVIIGGSGTQKIKDFESNIKMTILDDLKFSAKNMIVLTNKFYAQKKFEDIAYIEPEYLKPFIST